MTVPQFFLTKKIFVVIRNQKLLRHLRNFNEGEFITTNGDVTLPGLGNSFLWAWAWSKHVQHSECVKNDVFSGKNLMNTLQPAARVVMSLPSWLATWLPSSLSPCIGVVLVLPLVSCSHEHLHWLPKRW